MRSHKITFGSQQSTGHDYYHVQNIFFQTNAKNGTQSIGKHFFLKSSGPLNCTFANILFILIP